MDGGKDTLLSSKIQHEPSGDEPGLARLVSVKSGRLRSQIRHVNQLGSRPYA
jgi:hypothetical protein